MFTYAKRPTKGRADAVASVEGRRPTLEALTLQRRWTPTFPARELGANRFPPEVYFGKRARAGHMVNGGGLSVSNPTDDSEQEADALAERALARPAAPGTRHVKAAPDAQVQRQCSECEDEKERNEELPEPALGTRTIAVKSPERLVKGAFSSPGQVAVKGAGKGDSPEKLMGEASSATETSATVAGMDTGASGATARTEAGDTPARLLPVTLASDGAPAPGPAAASGDATPAKAGCALPAAPAWAAGRHVVPSFLLDEKEGPRSNSKPSTTTTDDPTFTGGIAVDVAGCLWHYRLASVEGRGKIRLVYFDADHYPAPTPNDDSGALSNITKDNYKPAIDDLNKNKNGIPDFWSAYGREKLHERYHWNVEWQGEVKKGLTKAEGGVEKLSATLAEAPTAADALTVLAPKATKVFNDEMKAARAAYDALGDAAGDPPYVAQAPAITALIARIKALAKSKKW